MLTADKMRPYQWEAVAHIVDNTHCALFLQMGLGKTVSTLTALRELLSGDHYGEKVLIVAPKRVAESVWKQECALWAHLRSLRVSVVSGTEKQRKAALAEEADIYTVSRDNVQWLTGQYGGGNTPFSILVIDELSSFKSHSAKRFTALKLCQPSFKRVIGLTGTPAPNGLIDLWPQIYLLDRGKRLGKNITAYREAYFAVDYSGYGYRPVAGSEEKIHEKISDLCLSMRSKDHIKLPPVTVVDKEADLGQVLDAYRKFERDRVLEYLDAQGDSALDSVAHAGALSVKLRQFAGGAVYAGDENSRVIERVHDAKLDLAEEFVEEANGSPVLIAWGFKHEKDRLMERLKKYKPRELSGDSDITDWNAGKVQVLLMHPASGGHGLNLQHGGHLILWYSLDWSCELYEQLNARLARSGQRYPVTICRLIAAGTIDRRIADTLEGKAERQGALMQAVKELAEKYKKEAK